MKKARVLFEGHDLKFLVHVINHYKEKHSYDVDLFTYSGHVIKDMTEIIRILPEIDVIFCEWGLGNLKWFSWNKLPGQKLITRIHLQEFSTNFLSETNWDNVDEVIVVGPFMKRRFDRLFPGSSNKCRVVPNLIDTVAFDLPKDEEAKFTLGLLGILPMRKWAHLGIEILEELRKTDERYRLIIKSRRPEEVDWLWRRPEEQEYYNRFFASIQEKGLTDAVIFAPHGDDVNEWFRQVGFILSPSEFESFHMAIAEGMASGTIPVIRNWEGASDLFPGKFIVKDTNEAVKLIRSYADDKKREEEAGIVKQYCREHFDMNLLLPVFDKMILPDIDVKGMRREYLKVSELSRKLASDKEQAEMAREKALLEKEKVSNDLSNLVFQQKEMVDNNLSLSGEISSVRNELSKYREAHQQLTGNFSHLQTEYTAIRDVLNHKLMDVERLDVERRTHMEQVVLLREEVARLQQEREDLYQDKETLRNEHREIQDQTRSASEFFLKAAEKQIEMIQETHLKQLTITRESQLKQVEQLREIHDQQLGVIRASFDKQMSLTRSTLEKEINRLNIELHDRKRDLEHLKVQFDQERYRLLDRIDQLKNINIDLERRLIKAFSSLTWKVGAVLVKKPGDLIAAIRRKLSPKKRELPASE